MSDFEGYRYSGVTTVNGLILRNSLISTVTGKVLECLNKE